MSASCNSNCGTCNKECGIRKESPNEFSRIKKIIGVVSGKGGVGKSTITSLLAARMAKMCYSTAILDADITGPSIPKAFNVANAQGEGDYLLPCVSEDGVKIMSLNLLVENETDPVVWRGPIIGGTVKQFFTEVSWGDVDYMFVDMPPGTGDVALTVFQSIPLDGIIVVTTPQQLVGMIVEKAVKMAYKMDIPILGIVENMSYLECPDCKKKMYIFGEGKIEDVADKYNIKAYASLPIKPEYARAMDEGRIEKSQEAALDNIVAALEAITVSE